ncbi:hypothetical protein LXL04_004034 [Taraxacum kok-saghyz]
MSIVKYLLNYHFISGTKRGRDAKSLSQPCMIEVADVKILTIKYEYQSYTLEVRATKCARVLTKKAQGSRASSTATDSSPIASFSHLLSEFFSWFGKERRQGDGRSSREGCVCVLVLGKEGRRRRRGAPTTGLRYRQLVRVFRLVTSLHPLYIAFASLSTSLHDVNRTTVTASCYTINGGLGWLFLPSATGDRRWPEDTCGVEHMGFRGCACACYLMKMTCTKSLSNMTPHEAWSGFKPTFALLRTFSCTAYSHIPDKKEPSLRENNLCRLHDMVFNEERGLDDSSDTVKNTPEVSTETPPRKYRTLNDLYDCTPRIELEDVVDFALLSYKDACQEEINRYKARLVDKGYKQKYVIDYQEVFAPIIRLETIRIVLALAAQNSWLVHQMDVKTKFLHGTLEEDVYIDQLDGYEKNAEENKLLMALNSPRSWYNRKCPQEHTLFTQKKDGMILIVCIYVDDLVFTGND